MAVVAESPSREPPTGSVVQVTGPVVDIEFPADLLPRLYNAIDIIVPGRPKLVAEVAQQLRGSWVRCVAMGPTEGLFRGCEAVDRGIGRAD
jgi:F-type H+-transporting ATPase subunit beta